MTTPGYDCPASEVSPLVQDRWQSNYYSPLCRTWFKGQLQDPYSSYVTPSYQFAGSRKFGMTNCAPVSDRSTPEQSAMFVATLCSDSDISGKILNYFPQEPEIDAQYLIMDLKTASAVEIKTQLNA